MPADIYESIHAFFFILFFLEQNLSLSLSRPAYLRFLENLHDARCVDARFRPLENVGREVDAITQFNREKWPPRPAFRGLTVSIMRVAGSHLGDKAKISTRRLDPIPIKRYVVKSLDSYRDLHAREQLFRVIIYFAGNNVGEEIVYTRKGRFLESLEFMYRQRPGDHQRDISPLLSVCLFSFFLESIRGYGIFVIGKENYYTGMVLRRTIIKIYSSTSIHLLTVVIKWSMSDTWL